MNASAIIGRVDQSEAGAADKARIEGEALFFRAYWYNILANLYGGVPVYTEEIKSPRTDFTRATRNEVYDQARVDLERAITLLQDVDQVTEGRINKQAAQHLLAEVYISLGNYPKAIEAASAVINHQSMALMTTRFGSRASEQGDPYWDLFQNGNQNRKNSGNKEAILVFQYEWQNTGSIYGYMFPRQGLPYFLGLNVPNIAGTTRIMAFDNAGVSNATPVPMGGRGIGTIRPTEYFLNDIWTDGQTDYRNSPYIIVRDYKISNPNAAGYGEWVVADGWLADADATYLAGRPTDEGGDLPSRRNFYPFVMKFARTDNAIPAAALVGNGATTNVFGEKLHYYNGSGTAPNANSSMKDEYLFRLGGTYLLRAEAYIKSNQLPNALADINALRNRANATPATIGEINLNYLMDEQMRERYFEEPRQLTLFRMGTFVERTRAHNPRGFTVKDHQNLFPIPFQEIERNRDAVLEQNPGYN